MSLKIFILFALMSFVSLQNIDYCDKNLCKKGKKHIACKHKLRFDSRCPKDVQLVEMTPKIQDIILHHHNIVRDLVAGGKHPRGYDRAARMCTVVINSIYILSSN